LYGRVLYAMLSGWFTGLAGEVATLLSNKSGATPRQRLVKHAALHAKVSRNKYPQRPRIGGFRAKSYASDPFSRVLTVDFPRAAAATPTSGFPETPTSAPYPRLSSWKVRTSFSGPPIFLIRITSAITLRNLRKWRTNCRRPRVRRCWART
jgi:hypothetical protein